jgi:hypothetical protein
MLIYVLLIVLAGTILYTRIKRPGFGLHAEDNHKDLQQYLLGDLTLNALGRVSKPLLWIYVPLEYNSRNWESFGSRSSFELNQPYLTLTTQVIINKCSESFHIVIVDDWSFEKLLTNWTYPREKLTNVCRLMGFLQILYKYGGMFVPISFVCFRDLMPLYTKGTRNGKMFVCENINYDTLLNAPFVPDCGFMGCDKNNKQVLELSLFVKQTIINEFTYSDTTVGTIAKYLTNQISYTHINIIRGYDVGVMSKIGNPITLDDLMSSEYLPINAYTIYGIWIPSSQILRRIKYQWFARLSISQIENSDVIICKYMIHSFINDNTLNSLQTIPQEGGDNSNPVIPKQMPENELFWDTPLYNGMYGIKQFID